MPGYYDASREGVLAADRLLTETAEQFDSSVALAGKGRYGKGKQEYEAWLGNHTPSEAANNPITRNDGSVELPITARAVFDGDEQNLSRSNDFVARDACNLIHEQAVKEIILDARQLGNPEISPFYECKAIADVRNGVSKPSVPSDKIQRVSPPHGPWDGLTVMSSVDEFRIGELDPALQCKEIPMASALDGSWDERLTVMCSVQQWVDSLAPENGYESDHSLQCTEKCPVGCEKHVTPHGRSPLHHHFGYKSPSELFEKIVFSEDEETKAQTETSSTASRSSSSTNNTCERTYAGATGMQAISSGWLANSPNSKRDAHSTLMRLLKKGLNQGNQLPGKGKGKSVVVNGHVLSSAAVKRAEERAGKLRPGSYWYDCNAGFWGVDGGPCLGILPPFIEELNSNPMSGNCSNGETRVYVNGRELHHKDLTILVERGLSGEGGKAYSLGFDGVLIDETTGVEIKHLGKLAPTVERKGKGFGMFAANAMQEKTVGAHGKGYSLSH